jgi:protein-L-isoaspartate O-methyltransferase
MNTAARLADELGLEGRWRAVLEDVPRSVFVPEVGLATPEQGRPYPIDRAQRPEEWLAAVYSDSAVVTQRADGQGDPRDVATGLSSSSLSAPGIAFRFLSLLDPQPGERILEVGTGTGYTAAVLSECVGTDNVTTIEVDPQVAGAAAANLQRAGYAPTVVVGDGGLGCPELGPVDRVHATCAVTRVPYAWVEQTRSGGVIVVPWQPVQGTGQITRLTVSDGSAVGHFHGPCTYMMLRGQRAEQAWRPHHIDAAATRSTSVHPRDVAEAGEGARLVFAALAAGIGVFQEHGEDGSFSLLLYEPGAPGGSWAACDHTPGDAEAVVTQYGPRRLWDELEAAYTWWVEAAKPGRDRFGLTVDAVGERPDVRALLGGCRLGLPDLRKRMLPRSVPGGYPRQAVMSPAGEGPPTRAEAPHGRYCTV